MAVDARWRQVGYVAESDRCRYTKVRRDPAKTRSKHHGRLHRKRPCDAFELGECGHHGLVRSESSTDRSSSNICLVRIAQAMNWAAPSRPRRSAFTIKS